jgi:Tfp pilus assembly protein FimT
MRSGIILAELLLAVTIAGLLALFAMPRLVAVADQAAVRTEALRIVAALDAARGAGVRLDAVASLSLTAASYNVTAVVDGDTVMVWTQPGSQQSGVTLSGAGSPLLFGPAGLAMGVSNRTITLRRGDAIRRVIVSRYGRLTY